jgi:hypothetical protein
LSVLNEGGERDEAEQQKIFLISLLVFEDLSVSLLDFLWYLKTFLFLSLIFYGFQPSTQEESEVRLNDSNENVLLVKSLNHLLDREVSVNYQNI